MTVEEIGRSLEAARKAECMSVRTAALAAGAPPSSIWHYEHGSRLPSLGRFRDLCLAYGVSADAILGLRDCLECGRTHGVETAAIHEAECRAREQR